MFLRRPQDSFRAVFMATKPEVIVGMWGQFLAVLVAFWMRPRDISSHVCRYLKPNP